MAIGKTTRAYSDIRANLTLLLEGVVFCVDPSIGSGSSMPGWAVYHAGKLLASGVLDIDSSDGVPQRLQEIRRQLYVLYKKYEPDLLVYEDIPSLRQGGGNANSHASLLKAVGAILSVSGPRAFVGIMPISWKALTRDSYVKGDEADAREMGWVVISEAARILEEDPPGKARKKRSRKSVDGTKKGAA